MKNEIKKKKKPKYNENMRPGNIILIKERKIQQKSFNLLRLKIIRRRTLFFNEIK